MDTTATKFPVIPGKETPAAEDRPPDELDQDPLWLRRTKLVIFVAVCIELGMILVVMPWTPFWTENSLVQAFPALRWIVRENFMRGLVSGIGLVDVWMGIWEAAKYKEPKRASDAHMNRT